MSQQNEMAFVLSVEIILILSRRQLDYVVFFEFWYLSMQYLSYYLILIMVVSISTPKLSFSKHFHMSSKSMLFSSTTNVAVC